MNIFAKKVSGIFNLVETYLPATHSSGSFDVLKNKKQMLRELDYSRTHGNLVGIYCKVLGQGMFLVGVEDIVFGDDSNLIIFFPIDMSGIELSRRVIDLNEITMMVPFNNPYKIPARNSSRQEVVSLH